MPAFERLKLKLFAPLQDDIARENDLFTDERATFTERGYNPEEAWPILEKVARDMWNEGKLEAYPPEDENSLFEVFAVICAKYFIPKCGQEAVWDLFIKRFGTPKHLAPMTWRTLRDQLERRLPQTMTDMTCVHKDTNEVRIFSSQKFPRAAYVRKEWILMSMTTYVNINDLATFHAGLHTEDRYNTLKKRIEAKDLNAHVGIDGVPHSKSGNKKMTVTAIKFQVLTPGCTLSHW